MILLGICIHAQWLFVLLLTLNSSKTLPPFQFLKHSLKADRGLLYGYKNSKRFLGARDLRMQSHCPLHYGVYKIVYKCDKTPSTKVPEYP